MLCMDAGDLGGGQLLGPGRHCEPLFCLHDGQYGAGQCGGGAGLGGQPRLGPPQGPGGLLYLCQLPGKDWDILFNVAIYFLPFFAVLRSRNYLFSAPAPPLAIIPASAPATAIY